MHIFICAIAIVLGIQANEAGHEKHSIMTNWIQM
jgi:hypothetical protein